MRRTVLIILGVAGGLVALVLVAVAIAVATVDVNTFAAPLAARVKAATGRDMTIRGPLALELSLTPTLRADDVSLGNASWGSTPVMLHAQRVEAQVALLPLLHRQFEIVRIALVAPEITLETNASGAANWQFGNAGSPAAPPGTAVAAAPAVGIQDVEIRNGTLRYRDGATGAVVPVVIESFVLRARSPDAPIAGEFHGSVNGVPVSLRANLGSAAALQGQRWPYPVDLQGEVASRSTTLKAKVTPTGTTTRVEDLALAFGALSLDGRVEVDRSGKVPRYVVDLHTPRFAPEALALPAAAGGAIGAGGGASAVPPARPSASKHVIPDDALPLAALRGADAEGRLSVDTVALAHGQSMDGLRVQFALRDGRLEVREATGKLLGGTMAARGTLAAAGKGGGAVDVHAEGRDLDLAPLLALVGSPRPVTGGKTRITLDARGTGDSLHDWASTLDGNLAILVGPAQLRNVSGNTSKLDELGVAVNPFRNVREATELRCAVVRVPLHDGVAHVDRTIAIETGELGVSASGTVDLRNETIDLTLKPQLRQGISLDVAGLADAVRVRGPFTGPQVSVDPAKSAQAIARIGAAIGTGGWSLLGEQLLSAGAAADSPCAIAQGQKPAAPARGSAQAHKPSVQVPGDLGKALGRLLGR